MMPSTLNLVVLVIVAIGIHEFGHLFAARIFGVPVERFSIGFGRPLLRHVSRRSGTEYRLGWLPVGGYIKMRQADANGLTARQRGELYDSQPVNHRALIALAGPGANLLLALLIYWLVFFVGVPDHVPVVMAPAAGTPAAAAGVQGGERVLAVDGAPILGYNGLRIAVVGHVISGLPLRLSVRAGQAPPRTLSLDLSGISTATLHPMAAAGLALDGQDSYPITARIGPTGAFVLALNRVRQMSMMLLRSLNQYVFGPRQPAAAKPAAEKAGTAHSAAPSAIAAFLSLVAFININLGIVNLLPLPLLDGGQLVLLYAEAVTKKRLSATARRVWLLSGVAVILAVSLAAIHGT